MCKVSTVGKKYFRMRGITRKTLKILIERNIDRNCRTKYRHDICGVLVASNVVMAASDDVLAESDDVLESLDANLR